MKLNSLLYYRYLFRQTLLMFVVLICLIGIINIIIFASQNFDLKSIWIFATAMTIWIFPLLALILTIVYFFKFINLKKHFKTDQLYLMLTNQKIRQAIVKSQSRIKIWLPKPNQAQLFIEAIKPEVEKQKKLLAIKKGQY